jgi:hypothetical protein
MATSPANSCSNCKFFKSHPAPQDTGTCHIVHPPAYGRWDFADFPVVDKDGWCGEHKVGEYGSTTPPTP